MAHLDSNTQNGYAGVNGNSTELSAAQKLLQRHAAPNVTVEDVPDEADSKHPVPPLSSSILESNDDAPAPGWVPPMSTKAAGKRKEEIPRESKPLLDTQSEELFPGLGAAPKPRQPTPITPTWGAKSSAPGASATNGTNGFSTNGTSTPPSGINTPTSAVNKAAPRGGPRKIEIPGQVQERIFLEKNQMLPRPQLKKPLPDILKDINRKSKKVNVTLSAGENGTTFYATGPSESAVQALRDVVAQVGAKVSKSVTPLGCTLLTCEQISTKVPIPQSARAHIIGKQGSKIKELQERTGARIQVPKLEDTSRSVEDDDDVMIDIIVEGNALSVGGAQREILKIAGERTPTITTRLRNIPAELYPFIAGPQNEKISEIEEARGVQIRIPPYHIWRTQPPPQKPLSGKLPVFLPAADDNHITIAGDRPAVQSVRAEIERLAEELQREMTVDQFPINNGRHQFIIGRRGVQPQKFFSDTGCAIILPGNEDDDLVTIVGPPHQTPAARNLAINLAASMQSSSIDISKQHRNAPGASAAHARNLTQYLRHRKVIEELEKTHQAHIVTSLYQDGGAAPWELYSRDYNNAINAQAEITNIVSAHPPARLATVPVDPFFHMYLQNDITPRIKKDYGVHVVVPQPSEPSAPVLLVFEGEGGINPDYQVPHDQPSPEEIRAFQQGLQDAQKHILDIISAQAKIITTSIDVPKM